MTQQQLAAPPMVPDTRAAAEGDEEAAAARDAVCADVQAAVLSHGARVATLAAARARGGIYTARPWQASSETESESEDIIENLQVTIYDPVSYSYIRIHSEEIIMTSELP